jgi:hypothetical protein
MKLGNAFAFAIVGALLASACAGSFARAEVVNVDDDRELYITATDLDNSDRYVGEQDVTFYVTWFNDFPDSSTDDDSGLTSVSCTIGATVRTVQGTAVSPSPISNWDDNDVPFAGTMNEIDWVSFNGFSFDVAYDAVPGTYNLTVTLHYTDTAGPRTETEFIHFTIASCIAISDIGGLMPGDRDKEIFVMGNKTAGFSIWDVYLNITRPDSDFTWFGTAGAVASSPRLGAFPGTAGLSFRISVSADKDAGTYAGSYIVEYTNADGVRCEESGEIDFEVGHLAMIGTASTTTSINQGTNSANVSLVITNTGTVDLLYIRLMVDAASADFTFVLADHWEGGQTVSYASVDVGTLPVGQSVTRHMTIGFSSLIPEGPHKIMFAFEGYYYDPDQLRYPTVHSTWERPMPGSPYYPVVSMDGFQKRLTSTTSSVGGPFVMLDVVDSEIDVSLTGTTTLSKSGRLVDNALTVELENYGNIDYENVALTMETNSAASPFLNAIDPTAAESEAVVVAGTLFGGSDASVVFRVTLSGDAAVGVYTIPVTITAINVDMGVEVEDTIEARVTIRGMGPQLIITGVTPEKISPGKDFTMTLTIENKGDDTARNVVLWSVGNGVGTGTGNSEENGDLESPAPLISPIAVGDIAPGQSVEVEIKMKSNSDLSGGHVYQIWFEVSYVDSFGYGPSISDAYHAVAVKSSGMGGSSIGMLYLVLTMVGLVVFFAIIIIVYVWARRNWVPRKKKGKEPTIVASDGPEQQ